MSVISISGIAVAALDVPDWTLRLNWLLALLERAGDTAQWHRWHSALSYLMLALVGMHALSALANLIFGSYAEGMT